MKKKRILSLFLAMTMCFGLFPTAAFAAKGESETGKATMIFCDAEGNELDNFYYKPNQTTFYLIAEDSEIPSVEDIEITEGEEFVSLVDNAENDRVIIIVKDNFEGAMEETLVLEAEGFEEAEIDIISDMEEIFFYRRWIYEEPDEDSAEGCWGEKPASFSELDKKTGTTEYARFYYCYPSAAKTAEPLKGELTFEPDNGEENGITIKKDATNDFWQIECNEETSGILILSGGEEENEWSYSMKANVEEPEDEDDDNNKEDEEDDEEDEIINSPQIPGENTATFEYDGKNYVIGFTDEDATHYVDGTMGNYTQDHLDNDAYREREQRSYIGISEVGESQGLEDLTEAPKMYELIEDIKIYTAVYDTAEGNLKPIDENDLLYSQSYDFRTLEIDDTGQYYVPFYRLFKDGYHYLVGEVTWKENVQIEPLQFSFYFRSTFVTSKEIDLSDKKYEDLNDLDELNDFIVEDAQEDEKVYRYDIIFDPEVTYNGTLELQGEKKIVIDGNGATLKGNVVVTRPEEENDTEISRYHEIHNLHMVSVDEKMVGISGTGNVFVETVNFEGYARAVETFDAEDTIMQKVTAYNCWFIDNGVGIYWDGKKIGEREGTSNYDIARCRFEGNGIGIQIVDHKGIDDTDHLIQIENCEFVDNDTDIVNKSKYTYWAEGCYFAGEDEKTKRIVSCPARTEKIVVSYIYEEPILDYQELPEKNPKNEFIDRFVGGTPVAPEEDFSYNNENDNLFIDLKMSIQSITVLGEYDLDKDKHELIGTWHFGEEEAE